MKNYKFKEHKDVELFTEGKEKLEEMSFMVSTTMDAEQVISACVKYIAKKKNMNISACLTMIGDGIITGIDEIDELFPQAVEANPESFQAKKRVLAAKLSRYVMAYTKTK